MYSVTGLGVFYTVLYIFVSSNPTGHEYIYGVVDFKKRLSLFLLTGLHKRMCEYMD